MSLALLLLNLLALLNVPSRICKGQTVTTGSGDGFFIPEERDENYSCGVPIYSQPLFEVNSTEESTRLLLIEGRCYLSCLKNRYSSMVVNVPLYPIWPFGVLIASFNCDQDIAQIHECTRGCRTMLQSQSRLTNTGCQDLCNAECMEECEGADDCVNPDSIDLWVARTGCQITCDSRTACLLGCIDGTNILGNTPVLPLPPVSSPILVELNDSSISSDRGLYSINLTDAVGNRDSGNMQDLNGFLFEIHDLASNNITYIWQNDPRKYLNLSSHICREVEVSFSVVNKFGSTNFSESTRLDIRGDIRELPNAPVIHQVEETLDRRNGFFQHVIINVTWESPQVTIHLMHFEVMLRSASSISSYCQDTNMRVISKVIEHTSEQEYSTSLKAEATRDDPIMGCNYTIMVSSVGRGGSRSVSELYTSKAMNDYKAEMMIFTSCNKKIAIRNNVTPYFNFYYKLVITTSSLADGDYISGFQISRDIVGDKPWEPGESRIYAFMPNVTQMFEDTGYTRFKQIYITSTAFFRFNLSIIWNMDQLLFTPTLDPYSCMTSALSPRPSDVRNFTVLKATALSIGVVSVYATWLPPLQPNGILSNYTICISRLQPLSGLEEDGENSRCEAVDNNLISINTTLRFIQFLEDKSVYIQIRPMNTYIEGNWSESYDISLNTQSSDALPIIVTNFVPSGGLSDGEIATISIIVIVIVLITVISLCVLCSVYCVRVLRRRKRLMKQTETAPNYMPMFSVNYSPKENPQALEMEVLDNSLFDEWEIPPSDVEVDMLLGEGAFGKVYRGILKGPLANGKVKPEFRNALHLTVAIKLLKDTARGSERQDFLSEIDMMKKVSEGNNPHVVTMLCCVTTQEPLSLITEYVEHGDLLSYLRSSRNLYLSGFTTMQEDQYLDLGKLTPTNLPSFSYQIAAGMAYLSSIGIVHRDLACRNVLISADKELKITDFGLSRETEDIYVQKSKGRVPYKWMAIESIIAREFTSASDVWAFGVVLWEIETLGGVPYPGVSNAELLPLLKRGHRMEKPDGCSSEVYNIMLSCWQEDSAQRPTFHILKSNFSDILASSGSNTYIDFSIDPNKLYYKTEEETEVLPSIHVPHPSPRNDKRRLNIFSGGSFEAVSLKKTSSSPQESPRLKKQTNKAITHSPSLEKFPSGQTLSFNHSDDRRPKSMMVLKHSCEQEKRIKSGVDQDKSSETDDRYVQDPSALLGIPNTGLETSHDRLDQKSAGRS